MAQYSLFVLKVPLNTNKPNQSFYPLMAGQLIFIGISTVIHVCNVTKQLALLWWEMFDGSIDKLQYWEQTSTS